MMASKRSKKIKPPEPGAPQPALATPPLDQATPQPAPAAPPPEPGTPQPELAEPATPLPPAAMELVSLVAQARAGNTSVLPRLREVLDAHPEIWARTGDLARITQQTWINNITGGDPLAKESMIRQAAQMKADLEGPAPTALERLLVSQVVVCWLELSAAEITLGLPDQTLRQARHRVHHAEVAQRKYLAAVKTLTTVRALQPQGVLPAEPLKVFNDERAQA